MNTLHSHVIYEQFLLQNNTYCVHGTSKKQIFKLILIICSCSILLVQ